jgi:hypothetical protein
MPEAIGVTDGVGQMLATVGGAVARTVAEGLTEGTVSGFGAERTMTMNPDRSNVPTTAIRAPAAIRTRRGDTLMLGIQSPTPNGSSR